MSHPRLGSEPLSSQHRQLLEDSAVSDEVARERGYWTATRKAELGELGFARVQQIVPSLVIPIRDARGQIVNYQVRPDQPRIGDNGKPVKYESPAGIPPTLDVPPRCGELLRRAHAPLWITEGARKADALASAGQCCVSLPGVWSWARRLHSGARQVLPDLQRVRLEDRKVIVGFDSDVMVKPQVHKALEALGAYLDSQGTLTRFLYLPELEEGEKCGLDDFLAAGRTVEELWEYVEEELRPPPKPRTDAIIFPTAHLLAAVEKLLRRYVRFPNDHGPRALALYVLHTWAIDAADATPYIYIPSPQKRSGKTRTLEALELPVREPIRAASITEAAIFQAIEAYAPTLLIDEVDALFTARSERAESLRGVLNAGNRRGSYVLRGSQDGTPIKSETFCPKVLAGINTGKLPDTIRDRAIVIRIERKLRSEEVARLRVRDIAGQVDELRDRLEDWATEYVEQLAKYRCEPIEALTDRLEEAWEPLLAIADHAGGEWPAWARAAAVELAGGADAGEEDDGELLLIALEGVFGEHEVMFTADICQKLNEDDELPFGAYRKGEGIDGRRLGKMLKPYGIKPKSIEHAGRNAKGYRREWFADAWERYARQENVRAQQAADDASEASGRQDASENRLVEPKTDLTDNRNDPSGHPSGLKPAFQSQNGGGPDDLTDLTDGAQPRARTHFDGEPLWKSAPSRPLREGE
jgi:hypothetical protein